MKKAFFVLELPDPSGSHIFLLTKKRKTALLIDNKAGIVNGMLLLECTIPLCLVTGSGPLAAC